MIQNIVVATLVAMLPVTAFAGDYAEAAQNSVSMEDSDSANVSMNNTRFANRSAASRVDIRQMQDELDEMNARIAFLETQRSTAAPKSIPLLNSEIQNWEAKAQKLASEIYDLRGRMNLVEGQADMNTHRIGALENALRFEVSTGVGGMFGKAQVGPQVDLAEVKLNLGAGMSYQPHGWSKSAALRGEVFLSPNEGGRGFALELAFLTDAGEGMKHGPVVGYLESGYGFNGVQSGSNTAYHALTAGWEATYELNSNVAVRGSAVLAYGQNEQAVKSGVKHTILETRTELHTGMEFVFRF